ncbi:MAG: phage tail protein [Pirellulaceae bacterium]|nr:phage tail protein [Pirellulaceae bacterium]
MSDPYVGEIRLFAGNYAPRGWAFCDGQLLAIASNDALFSLLGTTYGGDGRTTFALPDLRGRVPLHQGAGPGRSPRTLGAKGGQESVALNAAQMPAHSHPLLGTADADNTSPQDRTLAEAGEDIYARGDANTPLSPQAILNTGGSQPHANMQPFLGIYYIIALEGVYPSRS